MPVIQRLRSPWLALLAVVFLGCSAAEEASPPATRAEAGPAGGPRARVVTLTMSLETTDVVELDDALRALVEREGGYVERASSSRESASATLRVPADRVPAFRRAVRRLGTVTGESQTVEDVGDQRTDLDARLRSARGEEERLLALMSDRTDSLADVITVEERLANVRTRIEQLDAQRFSLGQRIEYAQVQVDMRLAQAQVVEFWEEPLTTIASAGSSGLDVLTAIVVGGAAAIAAVGPTALAFGLVLAMLFGAARLVTRRRRAAAS